MTPKSLKSSRKNHESPVEKGSTPKDWLSQYYAHLGGEIGVAFSTINTNTGWALTLLSLLVSGIFLSGAFPDIRSFFVLLLISVLLIRFFVRTTLGYQNLIRWNVFRNHIDKIFLGADKDGSIEKDVYKSIDLYDWRWFSPISRRNLFFANLRYGYTPMFLLTYGLATYAWTALDSTTVFSPSPARSLAIAVIFAATALSLFEIKGLYDPFYFKHIKSREVDFDQEHRRAKAPDQEQSKSSASKRVQKHKSSAYALALVLLTVSVILLAWPSTHTVVVTGYDFSQTVHGFSSSVPIELTGGDQLSFDWYSASPHTVVIAEMSSIQDFNRTGALENVTGIYYGQSGHAVAIFSQRTSIGLLVSPQSLNEFTGQILIRRTPYAVWGTILGVFSLIPLVAIVLSQASVLRNEEKQKLF